MPDAPLPTSASEATPPAPPAPAPAVETPKPETAQAPKPEAAEKPQNSEAELDQVMNGLKLDDFDLEQLAAFESGDETAVSRALGIEPVSAKPEPKAGAAKPKPEPQDHPKPEDEDEHEPDQPGPAGGAHDKVRISIRGLQPEDRAKTIRAIDLIRTGKTAPEAFAEVFGIQPQAAAPKPEEPAPAEPRPQPQAEEPEAVKQWRTTVADLEREYEEKAAAYDPEAPKLLLKIQDAKIELREALREAKTQAAQAATFAAEQQASHARALVEFNDLLTTHPERFNDLLEAEITLAERRGDPMLQSSDWPEKIGRLVRAKYFKDLPAARSAEPEPETPPTLIPPAPQQRTRLPGSPAGGGFAAGAVSAETALAEFDKLPPEQQEAALAEIEKQQRDKRR
jgi:hypothetical protein